MYKNTRITIFNARLNRGRLNTICMIHVVNIHSTFHIHKSLIPTEYHLVSDKLIFLNDFVRFIPYLYQYLKVYV